MSVPPVLPVQPENIPALLKNTAQVGPVVQGER